MRIPLYEIVKVADVIYCTWLITYKSDTYYSTNTCAVIRIYYAVFISEENSWCLDLLWQWMIKVES